MMCVMSCDCDVHDNLHDCYIFAPYAVYVFDVCDVHDNRNVCSSLDNWYMYVMYLMAVPEHGYMTFVSL
jgi:hypothetical protein